MKYRCKYCGTKFSSKQEYLVHLYLYLDNWREEYNNLVDAIEELKDEIKEVKFK